MPGMAELVNKSENFEKITLEHAIAKLHWGKDGVWSVSLLPEEARVLVNHLEHCDMSQSDDSPSS
jgi:hypothetical protein